MGKARQGDAPGRVVVWTRPERLNMPYKNLSDRRENDRKRRLDADWKARRNKQVMANYYRDKTTVRNRDKRWREKNKSKLFQLKLSVCCSLCDEKHPAALDFHHQDKEKKFLEVGRMVRLGYGAERVKSEIAKCIVLCANCHRKETSKQLGWYAGPPK